MSIIREPKRHDEVGHFIVTDLKGKPTHCYLLDVIPDGIITGNFKQGQRVIVQVWKTEQVWETHRTICDIMLDGDVCMVDLRRALGLPYAESTVGFQKFDIPFPWGAHPDVLKFTRIFAAVLISAGVIGVAALLYLMSILN